jgi:hypothetical protein
MTYDADDPRAYDEHGILRDGVTIRVGMMARDGASRDSARSHNPQTAGYIHGGGGYKPGHIVSADAAARDASEIARREMIDEMSRAWQGAPRPPKGDVPLTCRPASSDVKVADWRTIDAAESQRIRDAAYHQMVADLQNAWRGSPA